MGVYRGIAQDNVVIEGGTLTDVTLASPTMTSVTITSGTISGITDLAVADGGTGASTAASARTNLGLGTMATQAASAVAITGGTLTGSTLTGNVIATAGYVQLRTATSAMIAAIADPVNTAGKVAGTIVFNTTLSVIKVATGASANSTWVDADGTNAVTPA